MTRVFAYILLGIAASAVAAGGGRIAWIGAHAAPAAIEDYVADPRGTTFHKAEPRCLFVDPGREMLRYHGRKAAEDSGRTACQHCLNGPAVGPGLTSTLSRPRLPTGTQ